MFCQRPLSVWFCLMIPPELFNYIFQDSRASSHPRLFNELNSDIFIFKTEFNLELNLDIFMSRILLSDCLINAPRTFYKNFCPRRIYTRNSYFCLHKVYCSLLEKYKQTQYCIRRLLFTILHETAVQWICKQRYESPPLR